MSLLSCVMVSVSAHGPWDNASLSLLRQVQKPTALHNGVATLEMGLSIYTGYLAADALASRTTDNTLVSKLPYQLTGAFLGGVASNFSFCKPWMWTLGLGALGYKFRAPLYNVCA